jgi:hypothetical protein
MRTQNWGVGVWQQEKMLPLTNFNSFLAKKY